MASAARVMNADSSLSRYATNDAISARPRIGPASARRRP
jgi:hypothetical protein